MQKSVQMLGKHSFLGGRGTANSARNEVLKLFRGSAKTVVQLDFSGVEDVSHSYADELLSPLSDYLGERMQDRLVFMNCAKEVRETFRLVGKMHGLNLPRFSGSPRPARQVAAAAQGTASAS